MRSFAKNNFAGFLVAGLLALFSTYIADVASFLSAATIALALGMLLGNSQLKSKVIERGFEFTSKSVLELAIVLIGFGMNISIFTSLGFSTWFFVGGSVALVLVVAILLSRWFGLSASMGALIGAGSAICGSAAIGAVSPLLHSKQEETGLSIGIINLLSTLGLIFLPILSSLLSLSHENAGLIIGGILQSMGHVAGAGFSLGTDVGTIATVVKMGRILFIIPLILALLFLNRKKESNGQAFRFPLFIPLFIGALFMAQLSIFTEGWSLLLAKAGDFLLVAAMVAIGYKIKLKPLFKMAGPSLAVGFIVFGFQIFSYLLYLYFLGS